MHHYFVRNAHCEEVLQIAAKRKQQHFERIVEIVTPRHITVNHSPFLLLMTWYHQTHSSTLLDGYGLLIE